MAALGKKVVSKVWVRVLAIALLGRVRLTARNALQSRKWQLICIS